MSLYLDDTPASILFYLFFSLSSLRIKSLIFFILQQVGAEVSGLLTLQSVAHLLWLGSVGYHSDGIVVAHVLPKPVEQYHHFVLYAEDGAEVNHQPQYPGKEALTVELAKLYYRLVSTYGCHRTQILVAEWLELLVDILSSRT